MTADIAKGIDGQGIILGLIAAVYIGKEIVNMILKFKNKNNSPADKLYSILAENMTKQLDNQRDIKDGQIKDRELLKEINSRGYRDHERIKEANDHIKIISSETSADAAYTKEISTDLKTNFRDVGKQLMDIQLAVKNA